MRFELFNNKKKSPLYFIVRRNRNGHYIFLKYPVGVTLKPEHWNAKKQQVREIQGLPFVDVNNKLKQIREETERIFRQNDFDAISGDFIRERLDISLKRTKRDTAVFYDYLNEWIARNTERKGYDTIKSWVTMKNKLPKNLNWYSFDYVFYKKWIDFLEGQEYSKNYIGKLIKNLKIVLNHAYKEGKHDNLDFKKWVVPAEKVYNVFLSEKELLSIYNSNPPKYLHTSKDLFLVGCFTGMRVENYLNIDPNIQIQNGIITAIINKGGGRVKIPVHWIVDEILKKYRGLPRSISQQKLNQHIKLICQFAGIKEKIMTVKTTGGKRVTSVNEKWELCTTHTARRSMVTNLYLRRVPIEYIMSITGHKTERQCREYIKSGIDEYIEEVINLDFWKK